MDCAAGLTKPRVYYLKERYRWKVEKPNGDLGMFWEWETAILWALGKEDVGQLKIYL